MCTLACDIFRFDEDDIDLQARDCNARWAWLGLRLDDDHEDEDENKGDANDDDPDLYINFKPRNVDYRGYDSPLCLCAGHSVGTVRLASTDHQSYFNNNVPRLWLCWTFNILANFTTLAVILQTLTRCPAKC